MMGFDLAALLGLFGLTSAFALVGLVLAGWMCWRILERAGFSGLLSLFHLVPVVGPFVVMAILAFSDWPNGEGRPVRP